MQALGSIGRTTTAQARRAAVGRIAGALEIDLEEAQRWCDAWERFAKRQGVVASGPYYWDSARGWIDAQRSFERQGRATGRERAWVLLGLVRGDTDDGALAFGLGWIAVAMAVAVIYRSLRSPVIDFSGRDGPAITRRQTVQLMLVGTIIGILLIAVLLARG